MELSRRLGAVAALVTAGNRLADVGTDHGYIPIYLVEAGIVPSAIAMDVNKGPLARASAHIGEKGLEGQISTRLSDGLDGLIPGEADSVILAGMGGALTVRILERGRAVLAQVQELILQPQSEIERVRGWLWERGYATAAEDMVEEDGKFYPMMRMVKEGAPSWDGWRACFPEGYPEKTALALSLRYGPLLLRQKSSCLGAYLERESHTLEKIAAQLGASGGERGERRRREVGAELELNRLAKERIQ